MTPELVQQAINSSKKHGIRLRHGRGNPGLGDCAFEAVIFNNNDRNYFKYKYNCHINFYRRIWVTDMANRTVNSPWNTVGQKAWLEGWQCMFIPGAYEQGIYGDLMIYGIACGIKKKILIFNTNVNFHHKPISVIDPIDFGVHPDSETPIVVAYNMYHYESLEPFNETDIEVTKALILSYTTGTYPYERKDIQYLISSDEEADEISKNDLNLLRKKVIMMMLIIWI